MRAIRASPKSVKFALAFATTQAQLDRSSKTLAAAAEGDAVLWFVYPKGTSKRYRCEFNRDSGWGVIRKAGFESVRMVASRRGLVRACASGAWNSSSPPPAAMPKENFRNKARPSVEERTSMREHPTLRQLSKICLSLPEATRRDLNDHADFRVRGKVFAYFLNNHHGDGIVSVCCKSALGENVDRASREPRPLLSTAIHRSVAAGLA